MPQAAPPINLRAAVIGSASRPEFAAARQAIERFANLCRDFQDLPTLVAAGEPSTGPWDLIVLLQSHSGQFAAEALAAVRRRWPTSRMLLLTGVWSSGELRSGTPLAGVVRVPWHAATDFFARAALDLQLRRCPAWGQPLTASAASRWPRHAIAGPHNAAAPDTCARTTTTAARRARPIVVIDAHQPDLASWLADACHLLGLAPVWGDAQTLPHAPDAQLLLWLARQDGDDRAHLERLRHHAPHAPLVALASFLRPAELDLFHQAGAIATLALPLAFDELADLIARALHGGEPEPATTRAA